jgi:DNA polymerase III epsilon subunit family exonuclease
LCGTHTSEYDTKTFLNEGGALIFMDIVIVDIETTGLSRERHYITEIAAIKVRDGVIIDEFKTLINPKCRIPSFITRLTGISNDMVCDAPTIDKVISEFVSFCNGCIFVAHNASFDYGFLSHNASIFGHTFRCECICTRKLANRLLTHLPSKKLSSLCEYFDVVNIQAHRAYADALATLAILIKMQTMLEERGIVELNTIISFANATPQKASSMLKVTFAN